MLRLLLLGRPRIILDDQPVTQFVSEKALALFCYLAVRSGSHSRDSLAGLFWGEMSETRARANLRMALYNLQQLLPGGLIVNRLDASFNRAQDYWLDMEQLASLEAELADHHLMPGSDLVGLFGPALELYRGDLLEGLYLEDAPVFNEWLLVERERMRRMGLAVAQFLADQALRQGGYRLAAQALRRILDIEPWQESAHRQLMLSLARSGDTTGALAQFVACQKVLADGLGVEPMAETSALAERIRFARQKKRRHNLPVQPISFVGRTVEIAALGWMLAKPEGRLVTLTGPGGIGKTRLALQVASQLVDVFFEGVFFIPLADLSSPDQLVPAVLGALEIPLQGEHDLFDQLRNALRGQEVLLVLDSFEHFLGAARLLGELLESVPEARFLVTSRERLSLQWESVYPLAGLDVPTEARVKDYEAFSAVQFLLQCVRRLKPVYNLSPVDRAAILRICQVTEGIPLAIELAASWISSLSLAEIANAVEGDLDALTTSMRDGAPHHRSLRAAIDRSWELLSPESRRVYSALSVFRGGFTPEAALRVCDAPSAALEELALKSLLQNGSSGRFGFHELLRQYGLDRLKSDPDHWRQAASLHCRYYSIFLHEREKRIVGDRMAETVQEVREELENIRSAWDWAAANGDREALSRSAPCLSRFYELAGLLHEGENAFDRAVLQLRGEMLSSTPRDDHILAGLLVEQARFKRANARNEDALNSLADCLELLTVSPNAEIEAAAHLQWAEILERQGDYQSASVHYALSLQLAQSAENPPLQAGSLIGLGIAAGEKGDIEGAIAQFSGALHVSRSIGDRRGERVALHNLAIAAIYSDDSQGAQRYFEEQLDLVHAFGGQRWEVMTLLGLAMLAANRGDYLALQQYSERALQICVDIGELREAGTALDSLGLAALSLGRMSDASLSLEQALHRHLETGNRQGECISRLYLGLLHRAVGEYPRALAGLEEALLVLSNLKVPRDECALLSHLSVTHLLAGDQATALAVARRALDLAQHIGDPAYESNAQASFGRALLGMGMYQEAETALQAAHQLHLDSGQAHLALQDSASLADLAFVEGDLDRAMVHIETILHVISGRPVQGLEPFRVYLTAYRSLQALNDPRAAKVLLDAYDQLQAQSASILQPAQRKSFFERVEVNRALLKAWEESAPA